MPDQHRYSCEATASTSVSEHSPAVAAGGEEAPPVVIDQRQGTSSNQGGGKTAAHGTVVAGASKGAVSKAPRVAKGSKMGKKGGS